MLYQPGSAEHVNNPGPDTKMYTVVGVVREVQFDGLATDKKPVGAVYLLVRAGARTRASA